MNGVIADTDEVSAIPTAPSGYERTTVALSSSSRPVT